MKKTVDADASLKGVLLSCKRMPFIVQKLAFCIVKGKLLCGGP